MMFEMEMVFKRESFHDGDVERTISKTKMEKSKKCLRIEMGTPVENVNQKQISELSHVILQLAFE